jgi:hypothetical protein
MYVPSHFLRLVSYHIGTEVAQKGKYSLPEYGIVFPKHIGAIVEEKEKYIISVHLVGWSLRIKYKVLFTRSFSSHTEHSDTQVWYIGSSPIFYIRYRQRDRENSGRSFNVSTIVL